MKMILKVLGKSILAFLLLVAVILILCQGFSPVYTFAEPRPFYGGELHNPYQGLSSADFANSFRKTNLHAHQSKEGMPFEAMYDYSEGEFEALYKALGYDLALISDHQYINPLSPVPLYEHGVNLSNFHINCLGAQNVSWLDFVLMVRPRSQMQFFVNHLRADAQLLSVNHPARLRMFHSAEHLSTLGGYDLLEMDSRGGGDAPWDYALSAGHYVMLSATDDSHYPYEIKPVLGRRYTMVALGDDLLADNLYTQLKRGASYGVELSDGQSPRGAGTEPKLRSVKLRGDTLQVELPVVADSVLFIGQGGVVRSVVRGDSVASYIFAPDDTYIRAELYLPDGVLVWLNPVARLSALSPMVEAHINWILTILNSLLWFTVSALMAFIGYRLLYCQRCKKSS